MQNVYFARYAAVILALVVVFPAFAQREQPPGVVLRPLPLTTLVTPVLSSSELYAGRWDCNALNVTDAPLTVTVRAFNVLGSEVDLDHNTCTLAPGKVCEGHWVTGISGHYCTFTFRGSKTSVRAGLQVDDEGGFSVFAEAH